MGFPVRRPQNGAKQVVFAIPGEIDYWVQKQQTNQPKVEELESKVASLREISAVLRAELVVSELSLAMTLCQLAESKIASGAVSTAASLVQKVSKTAQQTRRYLQRPHHVAPDRLFDIEQQVAVLELRLGEVQEQLAHKC